MVHPQPDRPRTQKLQVLIEIPDVYAKPSQLASIAEGIVKQVQLSVHARARGFTPAVFGYRLRDKDKQGSDLIANGGRWKPVIMHEHPHEDGF